MRDALSALLKKSPKFMRTQSSGRKTSFSSQQVKLGKATSKF
jgi:hypothetical protein